MDGWMDVCMSVYVCMFVFLFVCLFVFLFVIHAMAQLHLFFGILRKEQRKVR